MAPTRTRPEWTLTDFVHRGPWWTHSGILALNLTLILPLLTAWSNGLDSSLINGLQILPAWQAYFHNPDGKILGLLNASQWIGSLVGLPVSPFICDTYGRKRTLLVGAVILLGGIALQSASKSVEVFVVARIILGVGLTLSLTSSPLLITELAYPTLRGKMSGAYNASWYLGAIGTAWAVFGVYGSPDDQFTWRIPIFIQAGAPILQLIFIWFIPESPRFQVSQGMESKAARTLARYHAHGDERDPLVIFELAQIRHAIRAERELTKGQSYSILWATPGNRKRMRIIIAIAIFSQWSGNGLISYYSHLVFDSVGITNPRTQAALNAGLAMWNFTCAMTGAMLIDKLGRRTLFLISNVGMLVSFCLWTITLPLYNRLHIHAATKVTMPAIFLFYMFYDLAYSPLLIAYSLEILPFHLRAKGFAVLNMVIAFAIAFNQFVNPWAIHAIGWWYYLVYVGFLIFELCFVWKYVIETKGRTLEETSALFDGEPTEMVEAAGEEATQHSIRYFVGRDTRDTRPGDVDAESKPPGTPELKEVEMYEHIEMSQVSHVPTLSHAHSDSRGEIDPEMLSARRGSCGSSSATHPASSVTHPGSSVTHPLTR